jgi:hypothetical protein
MFGTRLNLIVITTDQPKFNRTPAENISEIAALPLEGPSDNFAGRDHDSILYSEK